MIYRNPILQESQAVRWNRADRLGIAASAVCFVHCVFTPVVLSLSAVAAHYLPLEEILHRVLAVSVAALGGLAMTGGYRIHRSRRVLFLMIGGVLLIVFGAFWAERWASHRAEVAVTMSGSVLMIAAHFLNHTFCRNCRCCERNEV